MAKTEHITPIILCGGFGSRLWPLSREDFPKQFLKFNAQTSLFQNTVLRMQGERKGKFKFDIPLIATSIAHYNLVVEQLAEIDVSATIVLEPERRDSAAAILASVELCNEANPKNLCMVVASDHAIPDVSSFYSHIELALKAAHKNIVLFGIQPKDAATDYGYISPGEEISTLAPTHRVAKFAEKPSSEVAELYVAKGYLWNSGNFITAPEVLLAEAKLLAPEICIPAAQSAKKAKRKDGAIYLDAENYGQAKSLSIDFAVLERTAKAAVLSSNFTWSDLGTWAAIHASLPQDENGNATIGKVQITHCLNCLVFGNGQLTVLEGLHEKVVVLTKDAMFIAPLWTSAAMKPIIRKLRDHYPETLRIPKA